MSRTPWRRLAILVFAVAVLLAGPLAGCAIAQLPGRSTPTPTIEQLPPEFNSLREAWQALRDNAIYGDQLDAAKLSEGALRGMMQALDDPYAAYLDPRTYAVEKEDMGGSFEGIGAHVAMRESHVLILSPIPGSPAEEAGIKPGDIIAYIDGQDTTGLSLYEVIVRVRGPAGSQVVLGLVREGEDDLVTVTVTRARIDVPSVSFLGMLDGGLAHVEIEAFEEDTDDELGRVLAEVKGNGAEGLILDLRYNPGGLLGTVINAASYFLTDGLVLYEINSAAVRTDHRVVKTDLKFDLPVVVLVNQYSASGSEVLAGALRDHGKATLVGEKTFGKGSVNSLHPLSDGSAVYYTIAHWYTPNGTLIEGQGLEPDVKVENEPGSSEDLQLQKAIEVLRSKMAGR